jgi:hypothetical protein
MYGDSRRVKFQLKLDRNGAGGWPVGAMATNSFEKNKNKKINKYNLIFSLFGPYPLKFFALPLRNFGPFLLLKCERINLLELICVD